MRNFYRKYEVYIEILFFKKNYIEDSGLDNKFVKKKKFLKFDIIRYDCIDLF